MSNFTVEENKSIYGAKIKVVGVGGGGGNMVNHIIRVNPNLNIDLIVANTDAKALENSLAHTKIQLGEKTTKGLGAGMRPEVGKAAAEESYDEVKSALETSDIVFIGTGLGGGTGTGAAPVVAQAAKDIGALTVAVVTMPFMFEGKKRRKLADCGLEELRKESDSIVVIPNDKLLTLIDKNAGIKESFEMVDEVLARAVNGMSTIVLDSGKSDINLDFADVRTIMSHRGLALMGVGEANGEDAAQEAIKNAIQSPLLDNMTINGAFGILVHFRISPSCPLTDIYNAMSIIHEAADEDAEIIFGTTTDDKIEDNKVEVTIIATGFQGSQQEVEKNEDTQVSNTNDIIKKERILRLKKVSGGFDEDYMAQLDVPSFMRHQMD
ncbi:cell division protein FtsZ [Campylobacter concisus]|jgi:cell division protein ftsZ|uniref:Cell division protein FtsZ n=2 Tax=Campylobacter concisus TaxID=199 RepID=A0A7S9S6X2_9BACT|nr:cell division protein FtsZ [Campylobacter concisus]QPH97499.1 cell division protein FtsZ [Campylobacter concisus]QPI04696.1 cell division protein FtsZ [Campylobacter concisus]